MYGFGDSADFDVEDRVSATEGEQVIGSKAFGAYGDESDFGDEADFGNIGLAAFETDDLSGEGDTFDVMTIGDFEDGVGYDEGAMGFRFKKPNLKKLAKKASPMSVAKKAVAQAKKASINPLSPAPIAKVTVPAPGLVKSAARVGSPLRTVPKLGRSHVGFRKPKLTSAQAKFAAPMLKTQQNLVNQQVRKFHLQHKEKIAAVQQQAINSGAPIPKVMDFIPPQVRSKIVQDATVKAAAITKATQVLPKTGVPTISARDAVAAIQKKQHKHTNGTMVHPKTQAAAAVIPAGQNLTASDVSSTPIVSPAAAVQSASRSQYAHPMLAIMHPMGDEDGMGLSLSSFLSDAKKKAAEALKKATADAQAKLKQRVGEATGQLTSKLLNDPKVKAVAAQEAKQAAAQTVAEKLLDPTVQKKAGIGMAVAAGVVGLLAWKAMKK